ncbi:MAG: 2'-5' RNA ligase family protein [Planctomycetes bacterium]|nr:2'-5' RNA ligase family protein [Planctomycetota bacterium]
MGLAVELCFDADAERAVLEVWKAVRAVSGSGMLFDLRARPHVSLAAYPEGAPGAVDAVARFQAAQMPFAFASAGTFPGGEGVVFLAPVVDDALLRLHREWHALVPGGMAHYAPGAWVPHCTVGFRLPDVAPAVAAARAALPIRGRYSSIALVEYDNGLAAPVRTLLERPLVSVRAAP